MNLSELIDLHRGGRSYPELERDCGGVPSSKRLQQLVRQPIRNFPDPPTIEALARGLRVPASAVVLAAAESLGLDVRSSASRLVELLPADTRYLSETQAGAIAHLVRTMVEPAKDGVEDPEDDLAPSVTDVLAERRRRDEEAAEVAAAARVTPTGGLTPGQRRRADLDQVGEEPQD